MQARKITQAALVEALRRCRRKGGLRPRQLRLAAASARPLPRGPGG